MASTVLQLRELLGAQPVAPSAREAAWSRRGLAGRFVELSGGAGACSLTAATGLMLDAQREGELVAWITATEQLFFPPDLAESGLDFAGLVVIRAKSTPAAARAAERLLRSGAFGLFVLDLGDDDRIPMPLQSRLVGLLQKHDAALVCLTQKPSSAGSIGSLVSLRAEAKRVHLATAAFSCEVTALKDKRQGPGWSHRETCRGPTGLR